MRLLAICYLLGISSGLCQSVNYYRDIEPIIMTNCVSCHKAGGLGPFSLRSYEEVSAKGNFIAHVTKTKYMPPWQADPAFQTFRNEKILSIEQIQLIQDWVKGGMAKGKKFCYCRAPNHKGIHPPKVSSENP